MSCKPDSSGANWFKCAHGTVGCPRVHDLVTPHCIACAAGTCHVWHHTPPVLERMMSPQEYEDLKRACGVA